MSISKVQAEAIAEGFLDNLGTDRNSFEPKETFTEIILIAGGLILEAQNNLNKSNSNASGELSASLVSGEPFLVGKSFNVQVFMNFYGQFVNKGVKGTRSGSSKAGYSFKTEFPGDDMVKALKDWIDRGKISIREVKKYKPHGAHERKNHKLAKLSEANAAYAVARSIKQHGIKSTGFLDKAIAKTRDTLASRLGLALKIDIIDGLKK